MRGRGRALRVNATRTRAPPPAVSRQDGARRRSASPTSRRRRFSARARSRTSTRASCGRASTSRACTGSRGAARTRKATQWDALVRDEFEPRLRRYQRRGRSANGFLDPRAVYGYFPAAGSGDDVIVYDPRRSARARSRASRSRGKLGGEHLCLADYLREPIDGGASDVDRAAGRDRGQRGVAHASTRCKRASDYSEAYFLHGFSRAVGGSARRSTRTAASGAELGLADERGKRYSWGYGACPGPLAARDRVAAARRRERDRRGAHRARIRSSRSSRPRRS